MRYLLSRAAHHSKRPPVARRGARVRFTLSAREEDPLDSKRVGGEISFSEEKMKKNALFNSPRLFYDLYCLLPGQHQKVHAHEDSDKIYYVLEGTGRFTVGDEERDLPAGHAVIARAGEPHGVRNETGENLVLLITMAPRPS
jgi:mannose-6-phosphate isomerase-like protein (cupin superfamily)